MGEKTLIQAESDSARTRLDERQVDEFLARYGNQLLALARRCSASASDAEDAFQRGMETLWTKAPTDDLERLYHWARTVVRNEALSLVRSQKHTIDLSTHVDAWPSNSPEPEQRVLDLEQHGRRREALALIKPGQMRCLLLRAEGLDYEQIGEITGFSRTQIGRYLCEGRQAARHRVTMIEAGLECQRLLPLLSAVADGAASGQEQDQVAKHLRTCLVCRVTLRDFKSLPQELAAVVPLGTALVDRAGALERLSQSFESIGAWFQDRVAVHVPGLQGASDATLAKKLAGTSLVVAAIAGGASTAPMLDRGDEQRGSRVDGPAVRAAAPVEPSARAQRSSTSGGELGLTPLTDEALATRAASINDLGHSAIDADAAPAAAEAEDAVGAPAVPDPLDSVESDPSGESFGESPVLP